MLSFFEFSMPMRLIGSLTSPFVRKVRMVLAEKKLDYQLDLEDVWAQGQPDPTVQPAGQGALPGHGRWRSGLRLAGDRRVRRHPVAGGQADPRLWPRAWRSRTWEALADGLMDAAVAARLEQTWPGRTAEQRSQAWVDRQLGKVHTALNAMSSGLGEKPWCATLHMTLADISVACALAYLDLRFPTWTGAATTRTWASCWKKVAQRPSFIDTAPCFGCLTRCPDNKKRPRGASFCVLTPRGRVRCSAQSAEAGWHGAKEAAWAMGQ